MSRAQKLILKYRLPGLNQYTYANRKNKHAGASIKKQYTNSVAWDAIIQKLKPITYPVTVRITWMEQMRRDPDNISFGKKFIMDGLVAANVLKDDTYKWVKGFEDCFQKSTEARVIVELIPYEEAC